MHMFRREYFLALPGLVTGIFIILAIIGGARGYSPVPYWDGWGSLDFFIKISDGNQAALWAQHNEHRIVLTRLLSWVDFSLFEGTGLFLIIVNYALVLISFAILYACLQERLGNERQKFSTLAIGLVILTLLFSWIQQENFVWPFQNAFFLAQLLPLTAFYLIHKSHESNRRSTTLFILACLAGITSLGTLANGVITLPLMTFLALVLRMEWKRITCLAALAVSSTAVYFYNYISPSEHGSLIGSLLLHPFSLLQYVLIYIGGPFSYMTDYITESGSLIIAQFAGLFLIGSSAFFACRSLESPSQSSLQLALLTFLLYLGGTVLATGLGRLTFGIEQALSSRYMTPALMAWSSLIILYAPAIAKGLSNFPVRSLSLLILLQLLLFPPQLKALHYFTGELFERRVAALALELGVKDSEQISSVFPFMNPILELAKVAANKDLSIFGNPLIKDAAQLIGQHQPARSSIQCVGNLDERYTRLDGERTVRIQGWLTHPDMKTIPEKIHILDESRHVVGYALTGMPVTNVKIPIHSEATLSGFKGYLLSGLVGEPLIMKGQKPDCELKSMIPLPSLNKAERIKK